MVSYILLGCKEKGDLFLSIIPGFVSLVLILGTVG